MRAILLLALFALAISDDIPVMDVCYTSLCKGSRRFIMKSFKKFYDYNHLGLAEVNFIPYGMANETLDEATGKYKYECQFGENDCYGNLIEGCALDILGRFEFFPLIICMSEKLTDEKEDFDKLLEVCLEDRTLRTEITQCAKGDRGLEIMHKNKEKTDTIPYTPALKWNGVHDRAIENRVVTDMLKYICTLNPDDCDEPFSYYFGLRG